MKKQYKQIIICISLTILLIFFVVSFIKINFFKERKFKEPIISLKKYYSGSNNYQNDVSDLKVIKNVKNKDDIKNINDKNTDIEKILDDGSIIYDGKTLTELSQKLNKSLTNELINTGIYFANYTKKTGLDPYLAVAIVLQETGCSVNCSLLVNECNNVGGLKISNECYGYSKFNSLEEGINTYLDNLYNNYYKIGFKTPESMALKYAGSYEWADKVNNYIDKIKDN